MIIKFKSQILLESLQMFLWHISETENYLELNYYPKSKDAMYCFFLIFYSPLT